MKRKQWSIIALTGIITVIGIALLVLSSLLLYLNPPRRLAQVLIVVGIITFFGGLIGFLIYESRHPLLRCPQCGKEINARYVQRPGGGRRLTGREAMQCPHCRAMFQAWNLHMKE